LDLIRNMNQNIVENKKPILSVQHLYKSFGDNQVLKDINLELNESENMVVLGKSGSGKSVLIKCIIGLLEPDSGAIELFGKTTTKLNSLELDLVRVRIGFLFQSNALYDSMTVRENLEFPLRRHGIHLKQEEIDKKVQQALNDVGLINTIDMMPVELSGGMRKRIALARTLILQPEIILYDEPTTGLDPVTAREIIKLMIEIKTKYKTASIIISHDINCVKLASDRIAIIIEGRCYTIGKYEELLKSTDNKIKQFFE